MEISIAPLSKLNEKFGIELKSRPEEFHITVIGPAGGVGGDIHMRIVGVDEKGKPKPGPIEKKADPALRDLFLQELPNMHIKVGGEVGGPEKQQKQK